MTTQQTTVRHFRTSRQPFLLIALYALLFLAQSNVVDATRTFRPNGGTGRTGFGSVSQFLRKKNNDVDEDEEDEEPQQQVRPGMNGNDNTQFFETTSESTLQAAVREEDEDEEEAFFGAEDTEFPTGMPTELELLEPTASPMPTEEPTIAPSITPPTPTTAVPTFDTTEAPSEGIVLAPPRGTSAPTVAPTLVLKEVTSPTLAPATEAPTRPVDTNRPSTTPPVAGTVAPSLGETMSATPVYTWPPTYDPLSNTTENDETVTPTEHPTEMPSLIFAPIDFDNVPAGNATTNTTSNVTEAPTALEQEESVNTSVPTLAPTTEAPTETPTEAPTFRPTTMLPTSTTTTSAQEEVGEFPLSGQISLYLQGITNSFGGDTRLIFLATADEFITSASTGMVDEIRVMLLYQLVVDPEVPSNDDPRDRRLQSSEVLQVDLGVEGLTQEETFSASDWNRWLQDLFQEDGLEMVTMLQEMGEAEGNSFFKPLEVIAVVEKVAIAKPTPGPITMAPQSLPVATNSNEAADAGNDNDGVPLIAIIGAAVGGFVFLAIGLLLIRYVVTSESRKRSASSQNSGPSPSLEDHFGPTPPESGDAPRNSRNSGNMQTLQPKPSTGGSSISSESYLTNSGAMNFAGSRVPAPASESDNASQMGGTITSQMGADMSQMDNMSYAYSLEPGIEPSVAGVPQSVAASHMSFSAYPGGSSVASMTSGTSSFAFMKLPMISKSGSGGGIAGKPTTEVLAPPGKLGIVIDTTMDGPVVHKVNPGSALEGKMKSGDIIVAIDDVDTRAMTAASITALMVKTANQRRKLTIVSP